ncbi:MAG TPA: hypothetical protein VJJ76_00655 [archaeon]|nr:hypothetical protein [archaeon]
MKSMKKEEYRKEYEEKFVPEEEAYERLQEDPDKLVKIVGKYKPKEYEEEEQRLTEIIHQKVSTPVLKSMIKDMQAVDLKPLDEIGERVSGTLFDKIRFLRERIEETEEAIRTRELMNAQSNKEIDVDIADLEQFLQKLSNKDEVREFKLNVTLLRMEKRKENNLFWRDITTMRQQLQELREQYETESNIASIFSGS